VVHNNKLFDHTYQKTKTSSKRTGTHRQESKVRPFSEATNNPIEEEINQLEELVYQEEFGFNSGRSNKKDVLDLENVVDTVFSQHKSKNNSSLSVS